MEDLFAKAAAENHVQQLSVVIGSESMGGGQMCETVMRVSFFEVYMDNIYDLMLQDDKVYQ